MSHIPRPDMDLASQSQQARRNYEQGDQLDRVTGSGKYATGPTDGTHFGLGSVVTGVCVAFFLWIPLQAVGLHAFWSIPAGAVAIFLVPAIAGRKRSEAERRPRSVLFFTLLGAIAFAPLGVWFAVSEGDIPVMRAGLTLAAMGAVLGFVVGLLAKARRAIRNRRMA